MQSCSLFKMDLTDTTTGPEQRCKNCQQPRRLHNNNPITKSDQIRPAVKVINQITNSLNQNQKPISTPQTQQTQQPTQNKLSEVKVDQNPITFKKSDSIEEPSAEKEVYTAKEWGRQNVQMISSVDYPNLSKQLSEQDKVEQSTDIGNNLNKSENNVLTQSQPQMIKSPIVIKMNPPQTNQTTQPQPQQVTKQVEPATQQQILINSAPAEKPLIPQVQIQAPIETEQKPKTQVQGMQQELAKNSPPQIKLPKQDQNSTDVRQQSRTAQMQFNPAFMMPGARPPPRSKSSQQKEGEQEYLVLDRPMPHNNQKRQIDFA